jgi:hypothetical protein
MSKWIVAFACVLALTFPREVSSETPPSVAGEWEVTTRLPDKVVNERWTIQQKGATITATARGAGGDLPVSGSIAGASFRVTIKDGDQSHKVRAMVDGDAMEGTVTYAAGEEYAWRARRSKTP